MAVLIAPVGLVMGIVAAARGEGGHGAGIIVLSLLMMIVIGPFLFGFVDGVGQGLDSGY